MTGSSEPQTISLLSLADRFIEDHKRMPNRSFAFVLGAGASRSSGIKGASQMVEDWIRSLHREASGAADGDGKAWANEKTLGIANYDPADPAACYSELYRKMYARDPDRGYAYLEEQLQGSEPSYGYSVLARIMEDTRHNVVVTTNFDNLVADALSIFGKTYPLVCGHESLAGFISSRMRRPLVVKVHRDLLLAPKSAPEELTDLPEGFRAALTKLFGHYTPIVIGYGGNDGSLMGFLKNLPERSVPGGLYWCYWEGAGPPPSEIRHFVAAQNGCLVPIPGFDEAMLLLGDALEFDVPDKFVLARAEDRAKRIVEQAQALQARLKNKKLRASDTWESVRNTDADAFDSTPMHAGTAPDEGPTEINALAEAVEKTMQRTAGALRWWQWYDRAKAATDILERDRIYQEAIAALPDSAELLNVYAIFLSNDRKDHDKAETYFRQSLAKNPTNAVVLGNYAYFLQQVRKDPDKAETYFTQALAADPTNAIVLGKYAFFLQQVRKDPDKAETYFTQAIAADPNNVVVLCNYAYFLTIVRKDHDKAEAQYKRALTANPTEAYIFSTYARFLLSIERTDEGLAMLDRAVAAIETSGHKIHVIRVWMYATCHWIPDRWLQSLAKLKQLLLTDKNTDEYGDFTQVIEAAKKRGHPAAEWLDPLAAVCNGTADPSTLDGWDAWQEA